MKQRETIASLRTGRMFGMMVTAAENKILRTIQIISYLKK